MDKDEIISVPEDEAARMASNFPDDIKRFLNEQIRSIVSQEFYPEYGTFERFVKDKKYFSDFLTRHNEIVVALQNQTLTNPSTIDSFSKKGIKPEQFLEYLITGIFIHKVDSASMMWVCTECRRVIGLLDEVPAELKSKYPALLNWVDVSAYFGMYKTLERIVCPRCSSKHYLTLNPRFLRSGIPLQDQIDKAKKLSEGAG